MKYDNRGFSSIFIIVIVLLAVFLVGAFSSFNTLTPSQGIPDPNQTNQPPTQNTLQLNIIPLVTITPTNIPMPPSVTP